MEERECRKWCTTVSLSELLALLLIPSDLIMSHPAITLDTLESRICITVEHVKCACILSCSILECKHIVSYTCDAFYSRCKVVRNILDKIVELLS